MGLDELALCIKKELVPKEWLGKKTAIALAVEELQNAFPPAICQFRCRRDIEDDASYKQLIPYVVVQKTTGEILAYQRHGTETRLTNLWSIGVGGHINSTDVTPNTSTLHTILNGMTRECQEELGMECKDFDFLGIINEEETPVGHVHLGLVFRTTLPAESHPESDELGTVKFLPVTEVHELSMELWSSLALKLLIDK